MRRAQENTVALGADCGLMYVDEIVGFGKKSFDVPTERKKRLFGAFSSLLWVLHFHYINVDYLEK